jgi:hypothetical protein
LTRTFGGTLTGIRRQLREQEKIKDVMLMYNLDFNPETWRHWKSKCIEYFEEETFTEDDSSYRIVYDKKQKLWTKQDV